MNITNRSSEELFDRSSTLLFVPEKWNSQGIMLLEVVLVFARSRTILARPITPV